MTYKILDYFCFNRNNKIIHPVIQPLKWFNRFSLLFGYSISSKGLLRIYNSFYAFLLVLNAFYQIIKFLLFMENTTILTRLDFIMYYSGQLIYLFAIHVYGHRMYDFFNSMSTDLTLRQKKIIQWISILGWIPIVFHRMSCTVYRIVYGGLFADYSSIEQVGKSLHINHISHAFVLYLIFLVTCYFSCSKLLLVMKNSMDPLMITQTITKIEKRIKGTNRIASLPFFVLLPYLFVCLPAYSSRDNFNILFMMLMVMFMLMYCMMLLLTVFTAITFKNKLESQRKTVIRKLMTSDEAKFLMTNKWNICITRLSDEKLFDFSVMSLFSIDFSFLTSFSCALISYSILFYQLQNSTLVNQTISNWNIVLKSFYFTMMLL